MGDKFHLKLNTNEIPIAHKYREGKMQRTLKRGLKGTEIAEREVEGCVDLFRCYKARLLISD
jgi:hypothetical protein